MGKHNWDDFSSPETDALEKKFLPHDGEGETMATQAVTATSKLIYKWFNDGDVFDNTYGLEGWANDLSSYANWLYKNVPGADAILDRIKGIYEEDKYTDEVLWPLHSLVFNAEMLSGLDVKSKSGSVYDCDGPFVYSEESEDEDEEYTEDDDESGW